MELRIQTIPAEHGHDRYRVSSESGWTPCGDCWHWTPESAVRHFNKKAPAAAGAQTDEHAQPIRLGREER